ncbi:MAG TPA: glycosyltransferase [Candidatus Saccharimonadia bacterium]|nr:glycosyltransferase [Candidatus Saccharimonadia bacterium]
MKILLLTRTLARTGGMIIVSSLVRQLSKRGFDITFVAFKPQGTPEIPDDAKDLYKDLKVTVIEIPRKENADTQIKEYIGAAAKYLREHHGEYDKIILDSWYIMMAGAIAQVIAAPKVFHLVQRDPVFEPENDSKIWTAFSLELAGLFKMQRIVVGRSLAEIFKRRYGVEHRVLDIYVDEEYRKGEFTVRDRKPIKFLASAANFNQPWKGLDFLLESLENFSEHQFELTLVTSNPVERDLSTLSFPTTVEKAQTPLEMRQLLLEHDVYICTSTSESFCLALAEAVTLGMPAMALNSIGNRDYANSDNFYFVKTKEDFLSQLSKICNLDNRKKLHAVARDSMAKYTIDTMTKQFLEALHL